MSKGWIGIDLDGTLARYDSWKGEDHIGEPVPAMVDFVKKLLDMGVEVKIFSARGSFYGRPLDRLKKNIEIIQAWCEEHIGQKLPVTSDKDYEMIALYDDRAYRVEFNTGRIFDYPGEKEKSGDIDCKLDITPGQHVDTILEWILELFDEEYNTKNQKHTMPTEAMKNETLAFLKRIAMQYKGRHGDERRKNRDM